MSEEIKSDIDSVIASYRRKAFKELLRKTKPPARAFSFEDLILQIKRPYFESIDPNDTYKVVVYRLLRWSWYLMGPPSLYAIHLYSTGFKVGSLLVYQGYVKKLDDLKMLALKSGLGIMDILPSKGEIIVHVYEGITCSGLPNVGYTLCHFEAGIIAGVISALKGEPYHAFEEACWGTGYSFCRFRVRKYGGKK